MRGPVRGSRVERSIVKIVPKGDQAESAWIAELLESRRERRKHLCRRQSRLRLSSCCQRRMRVCLGVG